ncbi:response regulator [Imhoffiella purpurea]|uniref:Two-component response regulator n=1 Tax=Imhoffiella purpurea TaxID=1249627 RepID=W9VBC2_9GAMM|nr:response regulator [Imhoffiella purpurea]EXJ13317.1 two-component response regulator [Imhoffiella purpurea]
MMEQGILLCVDDEMMVLSALRDQLRRVYGHRHLIEIAESAEEGLEILDELAGEGYIPLVIISDWLMPGMKGDEFLIEAHRRFPHVIKIMLSGQADDEAVLRARAHANLHEFIVKPWCAEVLIASIDAGLDAFWRREGA